jgi:site-specific recombinase XerD
MIYEKSSVKNTLASVPRLSGYIERFTRERQYLKGVTRSTLAWYRFSFRPFGTVVEAEYASAGDFKAAVVLRIEELQRQGRGNSAVSINTYLRCFKAFPNWAYVEQVLPEPIKLAWLKEEQKVLATLPDDAVRALLGWKPRTRTEVRLHTLVCLLLDTGLRISEALGMTVGNVDMDSLVLKVHGKGNKHRVVPFSSEMRKVRWKYLSRRPANDGAATLLFQTQYGTRVSQRDVLRDLKIVGRRLGISGVRMSPHKLRHTFATAYIRNGGDVFRLQRVPGHSTLEMTRR